MPNVTLPTVSPKGNYGTVTMTHLSNLFDLRVNKNSEVHTSEKPPTFEELNISNWLVLYEAKLSVNKENAKLHAVPKDRALVYLDGKLSGTLSRTNNESSLVLNTKGVEKIQFLVENQGRINFGNVSVEDFKVELKYKFTLHFLIELSYLILFFREYLMYP